MRFSYGRISFKKAKENTEILVKAAKEAGVNRIVHISAIGVSTDSVFPYFKMKALTERAVIFSGLSYAIIRPGLIFGKGGILINNIAWLLRHFPIFAVPARGDYKLQPIFVEDVAEIAVNAGARNDNFIINAVGPESYTFKELIQLIAATIGSKAKIFHLELKLAFFLSRLIGFLSNDILLTKDELLGLRSNILAFQGEPVGKTAFSDWLRQNSNKVGREYISELNRQYR